VTRLQLVAYAHVVGVVLVVGYALFGVISHRHPTSLPPEPSDGVEVSGWATHDRPTPHATYPSQLKRWIRREFGPPPRDTEKFQALTDGQLASLGRRWIEATRRVTDLGVALMERHPMGPNTSRVELLGEVLDRILAEGGPKSRSGSLARASAWARELLPERLRSSVKDRLPPTMQHVLSAFWRTGGLDWKATRAFSMCSDLYGYVRVNLRGREAEGIVEPGAEYDRLCARIETGLRSFADADTGEPIVRDLVQTSALYPAGPMQAYLPDIVVRWSSRPAAEHRLIASLRHGSIAPERTRRIATGTTVPMASSWRAAATSRRVLRGRPLFHLSRPRAV
jgi:hypothetical protein